MRERLIEIFKQADEKAFEYIRENDHMDFIPTKDEIAGVYADHLLANGIIVPPCKVGDIVWVANKSVGKAFFNRVVCIIFGASRNKNTIVVEYRNTYGETSRREFKWTQFGKQVFFSREEAEAALKGW